MLNARFLVRNSLFYALQHGALSVCGLLAYVIMYRSLGAAQLGVWSLLMAWIITLRIGDFGLAAGIVRYVAMYRAKGDDRGCVSLVLLSLLVTLLLLGLLLAVLAVVLPRLLDDVLEQELLAQALRILPLCYVNALLIVLANIPLSALEGCARIDLRTSITTLNSVLLLPVLFLGVRVWGLYGVAVSYAVMNGLLLTAACVAAARLLRIPATRPRRLPRAELVDILGYSLGTQGISLLRLAMDPVTKYAIGFFGDAAAIGFYELASRLAMQIRMLLAAALQVVIPAVAGAGELSEQALRVAYDKIRSVASLLNIHVHAGAIVLGAPLLAVLFDSSDATLLSMFYLLTVTWWINTYSAATYVFSLGRGAVRINIEGNLLVAAVNLSLSFLGGALLGPLGAVLGWMAALIAGGVYLEWRYARTIGLPFRYGPPRELWGTGSLVLLTVLVVLVGQHLYGRASLVSLEAIAITAVGIMVLLTVAFLDLERIGLLGRLRHMVSGVGNR